MARSQRRPHTRTLSAQVASLRSELAAVLAIVATLREENYRLREENQALRDEVARLKGQKGKPSIGPSRLNKKEGRKRRGRRRRSRSGRRIDRTVVVKAEGVPGGSRFKGYSDFDVQELVIKTETVRYRVENWYTPAGTLISGVLPAETVVEGSHFGPTPKADQFR